MKHLGKEVKRELGRFGVAADLGALVDAWPEAVGETIARNAWPARVGRDGTLHVHTLDSVWAFELTGRAAEIAARLGVANAKFVAGPLPEPARPTDERPRRKGVHPSAAVRAEGERIAAGIEDENLRKIVARAAAASLASGLADRSVW